MKRIHPSRQLGVFVTIATALAACNAITGLGEDYRLADVSQDGAPVDDSGVGTVNDSATTPQDTGTTEDATTDAEPHDDASGLVDAGTDAQVDSGGGDAGLCGNTDSTVFFCTDFETATNDPSGPTPFGLKSTIVDVQSGINASITVENKVGSGSSRGLVMKMPASNTGPRRALLRVNLGQASNFSYYEAVFSMGFGSTALGNAPTFAEFGTFGLPTSSNPAPASNYGLAFEGGGMAILKTGYNNAERNPTKTTLAIPSSWYRVHVQLEMVSGSFVGSLDVTNSAGTVVFDKGTDPNPAKLTPLGELEFDVGAYNVGTSTGALEVRFDDIVIRRWK